MVGVPAKLVQCIWIFIGAELQFSMLIPEQIGNTFLSAPDVG